MPVCTLFRPLVLRVVLPTLLLAFVCSGYARADTWSTGQFTTYQQTDWAAGGSAQTLLATNYLAVYPTTVLIVGQATGGFSMLFDNASAISAYLPASGPPGALNNNLFDPTNSSSGLFGGDVLALQLDVDFSDVGLTPGSPGTAFGDLVLENYADLPLVNGLTVREVLADANTDLGGGDSIYASEVLDPVVASLTDAFEAGTPSVFAQDFLVAPGGTSGGGGGMTPTPEPSSALLFGLGTLLLGISQYKRGRDAANPASQMRVR